MTFSKTTEYALRTLTLMAHEGKELYSSNYLHSELKIPKKYLQRLLTDLSKSGLISSNRGKFGGFSLSKNPDLVSISEIIDAVEGFKDTPTCFFGFEQCALENPCAMHEIWSKSQKELITTLSETKLSQLIKK